MLSQAACSLIESSVELAICYDIYACILCEMATSSAFGRQISRSDKISSRRDGSMLVKTRSTNILVSELPYQRCDSQHIRIVIAHVAMNGQHTHTEIDRACINIRHAWRIERP